MTTPDNPLGDDEMMTEGVDPTGVAAGPSSDADGTDADGTDGDSPSLAPTRTGHRTRW